LQLAFFFCGDPNNPTDHNKQVNTMSSKKPHQLESELQEYKLVVMGSGGVGKSALTVRFVTADFPEEYDPTIEDSYRKTLSLDEQPCVLEILDTAGQEEFSSMQDQWMREGKGFLLVYTITAQRSLEEARVLREKILRCKDSDKVAIVLVGNKCDLKNDRQVEYNDANEIAKSWGVPFFEASAKLQLNNESCFHELVREIRRLEKEDRLVNNNSKKEKTSFWKEHCVLL